MICSSEESLKKEFADWIGFDEITNDDAFKKTIEAGGMIDGFTTIYIRPLGDHPIFDKGFYIDDDNDGKIDLSCVDVGDYYGGKSDIDEQ